MEAMIDPRKCRTDDVAAVRRLCDRFGVDAVFRTRSNHGRTCLHYAAEYSRGPLLWFLLQKGADPNLQGGGLSAGAGLSMEHLFEMFPSFLDASSHLCKRVRPSVGPSVSPSRIRQKRGKSIFFNKWHISDQKTKMICAACFVFLIIWYLCFSVCLSFSLFCPRRNTFVEMSGCSLLSSNLDPPNDFCEENPSQQNRADGPTDGQPLL